MIFNFLSTVVSALIRKPRLSARSPNLNNRYVPGHSSPMVLAISNWPMLPYSVLRTVDRGRSDPDPFDYGVKSEPPAQNPHL